MRRLLITTAVLIIATMLANCSKQESVADETREPQTTTVKTMKLSATTYKEYLDVTGSVEARNQINIIAEEGGLLKKIIKDKGHYEDAGDTLAILENKILEAGFNEAKASLKQAELDFKSSKVLYGKRAISENEYLAAEYKLDRARAAYDLAQARYSKLFITSPICALVNERYYDFGAYVMPMTPLFEVIDDATMKITAGVAERFLADIRVGTPVEIKFDAFPDLVLQSKISFVSKRIDPESRTFKIEVMVENPERRLAPNMIANLHILRKAYEDEIVIPIDALIMSETGTHVYVDSMNTARKTPVDVISIYEDKALVSGLRENQDLVILGQQDLSDGDVISAEAGSDILQTEAKQ